MKKNKISIQRLAKICNVSQGTVDRALHNRDGINPKTKEYILSVAREYGYRPNKKWSSGKSGLIGIIVFELNNEYCSELVMTLERELRSRGYYCVIMFSDNNTATERECIEVLYNAGVDGIILCPINDGKEFFEYLKSWKIPSVTVGNKVEGIKYVGIDNLSAMKALVRLVAEKGYKKIIYYALNYASKTKSAGYNTYAPEKRMTAFSEVADEFDNIEFKIVYSAEECIEFADASSAVIAYNDMKAVEVINAGFDGLVAGFDGIPGIYKYKVPVITVNHDKIKQAKMVVDYILNGGSDEDEFVDYSIEN